MQGHCISGVAFSFLFFHALGLLLLFAMTWLGWIITRNMGCLTCYASTAFCQHNVQPDKSVA